MGRQFVLRKTILKNFFGIVFFIGVTCSGQYVFAHPPLAVDLELVDDEVDPQLSVSVKHISKSPKKHYIRKIAIYKNNELLDQYYFVAQKPMGLTKNFSVSVENGDVVRVKATCNEGGSRESEMVVDLEDNESE